MNKTQMMSIDDEHANGEHRRLCGDHTKNNLPKFGYILDTNVIFFKKKILYFLLPIVTYHKNLAIEKKGLLNLANLGHSFHKKSCIVQNHISGQIWQKFASIKNTTT